MVILDTNVLSDLVGVQTHPNVLAWAASLQFDQLYLCTPVIAELSYGAERKFLSSGTDRYKRNLTYLVRERFDGRILSFSISASIVSGRFRAIRERAGRPVSAMDMAIAGIAAANNATLATRNVRDFEGLDLKLINPFEA